MRWLLLAAIRAYQRHLSPRKGYCCVYRVHTGRASCSTLGYRAVRRHGVFTGLLLVRRRTWLCGVAHRRYGGMLAETLPARRQRGFCDVDCGPGCDVDVGDVCDIADVCDCGDGKRGKGRKARGEEKYVRIPPQVKWPREPGSRGRDREPRSV